MNIRVSVDTMVYVVPILGDVKVRCSATIIDMNRNTYVDGIIAEEYLLKRRGIDPDTDSEILIYGDESRVEVCNTRVLRRAIEYILPPYVMDKIEEFANQKLLEAKRKVSEKKKTTKKLGINNANKRTGLGFNSWVFWVSLMCGVFDLPNNREPSKYANCNPDYFIIIAPKFEERGYR